MAAVLTFRYDCGYEISVPASRSERQELVSLLEDVADQRHGRECATCRSDVPSHPQPVRLPISHLVSPDEPYPSEPAPPDRSTHLIP